MFHSLRAALEVVYSTQDIWSGLPYVCIVGAIFFGGWIIWGLLMWLMEYLFLGKERSSQWVLEGRTKEEKYWKARPYRTCPSLCHTTLQTVFFIGLGFIIWIAGAMAGFNPWTSGMAGLAVSIIGSTAFAIPLSLIGSGYVANAANAMAVGQYWEFYGMGDEWAGRITAVYYQWVEMERYDDKTKCGELIHMPIDQFLRSPRKRNWHKEFHAKTLWKDPNECTPQRQRMSASAKMPAVMNNKYGEHNV